MRRLGLVALAALSFVLLTTGCEPQCVDNFDCRNLGLTDMVCYQNQCVVSDCRAPDATWDCNPSTEVCDPADGLCKTCLSDNTGCMAPTPACYIATTDDPGVCVECLSSTNCSSPTPYCDVPNQTCVECLSNANCSSPTPYCGVPNYTCMVCLADDTGCTAPTSACDITRNGGLGVCVIPCTQDSPDCDPYPATPHCNTTVTVSACVECVSNSQCDSAFACNGGTFTCTALDTTTPSGEIAAIIAAATGPVSLPVTGAFVTYLKPNLGNEAAGFFLQAEATGPAIFVGIDPATLSPAPQVGDRVSFTADAKAYAPGTSAANGLDAITALSGWTVLGSGHPIQEAPTRGLLQDISAATDVTTALNDYESELITITGTIAGPWKPSGNGMVETQITTAGIPALNGDMMVRLPDSVLATISEGCDITVAKGVMWRNFSIAFSAAYDAADVTVNSCPAPQVVRAVPTSDIEVLVYFNRPMDGATVDAADFTIQDNGAAPLAVSVATATGNVATLTTAAQSGGASPFTVTVGTGVSDVSGTPMGATNNTATFAAYAAAPKLVINEVDYDQPGTDNDEWIEIYNAGGAGADLTRYNVLLLNGSSTSVPRVPYTAIDLGTATLGGIANTTLPAGGYLLIASAAWFTANDATLPAGAFRVNFVGASNQVQNGSPDGLAIYDMTGDFLVDTVSYEGDSGTFRVSATNTNTFASQEGAHSTVNIKDPGLDGSIKRLPNGFDSDDNATDFTGCDWDSASTPGAAN